MKLLIVVDMQNDFIDGALGSKEAVAIVPYVKQTIEEFDGKVIFTRDTHFDDYMDTQEGKNLPVPHCVQNTHGWEIHPQLEALRKTDAIDKITFGSKDLISVIEQEKDVESITFLGLCTDICVASNALILKATFPEATVSVDPLACAGVTPASHDAALTTMRMCQVEVAEEQKVEDKKKSVTKKIIGIISNIVACVLYVPLCVYFTFLGLMFLIYTDYSAIWSVSGICNLLAGGIWLCTPLACVAAIIWSVVCRKKGKYLKSYVVQLLPLESVLLGIFCLLGAVATFVVGYLLVLGSRWICGRKSKVLRAVLYYVTITMLILDPIYLGVLYSFFGGGDMNGISLLIPELAARVAFLILLAFNGLVFWKIVLPRYTKSFQE